MKERWCVFVVRRCTQTWLDLGGVEQVNKDQLINISLIIILQ